MLLEALPLTLIGEMMSERLYAPYQKSGEVFVRAKNPNNGNKPYPAFVYSKAVAKYSKWLMNGELGTRVLRALSNREASLEVKV